MAKKCVYTVEPGRDIHLNGEPYISISSEYRTGGVNSPYHVDVLTKQIAAFLNKKGCLITKPVSSKPRWEKGSKRKK